MPLGYMLHKAGICESKYAAWRKECTQIDGLFMYQYNRYVKLIHIHLPLFAHMLMQWAPGRVRQDWENQLHGWKQACRWER